MPQPLSLISIDDSSAAVRVVITIRPSSRPRLLDRSALLASRSRNTWFRSATAPSIRGTPPNWRSTVMCQPRGRLVEHHQTLVYRFVDIELADFGSIKPGKSASASPRSGRREQPLVGGVDDPWQTLLEIRQVRLLSEAGQSLRTAPGENREGRSRFLPTGDELEDLTNVALQDRQVVDCERERIVDLVGHARGQRAQGGQFLGMDQLSLGLL